MMNRGALKRDLCFDEGVKLRPYKCTAGKTSIGVGRNLDDNGISEAEAIYLLDNDIARVERELDATWPWWRDMPEERQRALANMCFQLGLPRLSGFRKMIAALHSGDWEKAADEALDSDWAKQVPNRAHRVAALIRGQMVGIPHLGTVA